MFHKVVFFMCMVMGTLTAISSYSWFSMWIGLEVNLLSVIPLLDSKKNSYPAEASLKYFITQALASSILLLSAILTLNMNEFMPPTHPTFDFMMSSALLIKLGAAPFHAWFPEVLEGLHWKNCLIMLIWQKIAPMVLLFYNSQLTDFFLFIILISSIISGLQGMNQVSLRKIMAYSSINHISWMLASMLNSQSIWMFYFITYSLISLNIILVFNQLNIYYFTQLFIIMTFNKPLKILFLLNFLSLGGLPPFLGFYPKWLVINNLASNSFYMMSIMLIISTLITLYFYMRMTFSTLMITHTEVLMLKSKINFFIILFNFITLSGLFICSMTFNFN
uniref:NADH-ubiquinone oxidoreductase chain 2 n=1 Tax=Aulaconotus atronotatus TaxID=2844951 RepID=A0A8F0WNE0_9CUCU|nr:NADH dehydrogenase subunit 2 [Aulaconotus atronotatus]